MQEPVICHKENSAFLDALESCLSSGLAVFLDGIPQTAESLETVLTARDGKEWTGTLLLDDKGDLKGLSFSSGSKMIIPSANSNRV